MRTLLAFAGGFLLAGGMAVAQPEEGLVLHYTFDEGAGEVVHDKSGRGYDGKIAHSPGSCGQGRMGPGEGP